MRLMKTKLESFKITYSIAKTLAEQSWGRGGTSSYKTTRNGVFYFSCSGHGGYIVNASSLSAKERSDIEAVTKPEILRIAVQHYFDGSGSFVIGCVGPENFKRKSIRYFFHLGPVQWQDYEYFVFEEDCEWSILETFTDIRVPSAWNHISQEKADESRIQTFNQYYTKKEMAI
jgi:hypothetical protein